MAEEFRKINYMKKKNLKLTEHNVSPDARKIIEQAGEEDSLVLRLKVNSQAYIEAAAPLTKEGIKEVAEAKKIGIPVVYSIEELNRWRNQHDSKKNTRP